MNNYDDTRLINAARAVVHADKSVMNVYANKNSHPLQKHHAIKARAAALTELRAALVEIDASNSVAATRGF